MLKAEHLWHIPLTEKDVAEMDCEATFPIGVQFLWDASLAESSAKADLRRTSDSLSIW